MKVDGSLKSLLQGVSQQPPRDRLSGQCTAQINMSADPVTGLTRRPPTDLVGELGTTAAQKMWYDFETQSGNKYIASFRDDTLQVYNINAELQDLTIDEDAEAYLVGDGPWVCAAQENVVTISNTSKTVALSSDLTAYTNKGAGSKPQGIIQVLGGAYGREMSVSLDGTIIAKYGVVDGAESYHSKFVRTTHIAEVLAWLLVNTLATPMPAHFVDVGTNGVSYYTTGAMAGADWTVTCVEDLIHIKRNTGAVFLLSVSDDQGNLNMKAITESVPDVSDLPRMAPQGYLARIATETDPEEDMFVSFVVEDQAGAVASGAGFGKPGYWQECAAAGIKYAFDATTMPHKLTYDPVEDTFTFSRGAWKDRLVGTEISNPDPSFVGNKINDVSTFQNRLVFLAGSNTITSRTNRADDFWMGSASAVVESDPIDISSTAVQTSRMIYAVPHNKDLVVFAERGQFTIFGRTALTPANAAMVLTAAFEASLVARPAPAGRNVFFSMTYGRYAGLREFYTEGGTDIQDTRPITQHLKKYIVGTVQHMSTASNYDMLVVTTDTDRTNMYVYQYIWSDTEKVQSAWSVWQYPNEIVYTFFDRDVFYLVMKAGTTYHLLRKPLDVEDSAGMEFPVYLDARLDVLECNAAFTLPSAWLATEDLEVVQGVDCPNPGMRAPIQSVTYDDGLSAWIVTLKQDMLGGDVVVGVRYQSKYVPTMPAVKDDDGVTIGTGNLTIKGFQASVENTGDINGRAYSKWDAGVVIPFQGRVLGEVDNIVGQSALYTGNVFLPFRHKANQGEIEFYTSSFYPMTLLDVEWVGQYTKRGRRLKTGT